MKARERVSALLEIAGKRGVTSSELISITRTRVSTLYPFLLELEEQGLVRSEFDPGPSPRPRRYWLVEL